MKKYKTVYLIIILIFVATVFASALKVQNRDDAALTVYRNVSRRLLPTPVIDPGHGGEDGGAVSINGVCESRINLDVAEKLEYVFALCGLKPVMTRSGEKLTYPDDATSVRQRKNADLKRRAEITNGTENAVLISIHQNKYTTSQPHGAQVFFAKTEASRELAEAVQSELCRLDTSNTRMAEKAEENLYLMREVSCPAILVECGFLSNSREAALLETKDYQLKISLAVAAGYFDIYHSSTEETA